MQSLSDDIIIIICRYLTLLDVFHLRLTNRRLAIVVVVYGKAIAPFVARNTFPNATLLCLNVLTMPITESTWLEGLVHKYLAAVVVDRFHLLFSTHGVEFRGIPAEEEAGDAQRNRAENGWRVLSKLSHISHDVYTLPVHRVRLLPRKERLKRVFGRSKTPSAASEMLAILERRERMILGQRLLYLKGLDTQIVLDYRFMFSCMLAAFTKNHDPWRLECASYFGVRPYKSADRFDWGGDHGDRRLEKGNSWINWFIMHEGPALFWKQWKGGHMKENLVRERALQAWKCRLDQQIAIERDAVCEVETLLSTFAKSKEYSLLNPVDEFEEYRTHREYRYLNGYQPSHKEIFEDIPYNIEFRGWIDELRAT